MDPGRPIVFFAQQQVTEYLDDAAFMLTLFVRTSSELNPSLKQHILASVGEVDSDLVVEKIETTGERHWEAHEVELLGAYAAAIGGGVVLLIAAIGVYGVITFRLSQRRREVAIKRALGAREGKMILGTFREGMILAVGGLGLGTLFGFQVVRVVLAGTLEPEAMAIVSLVLMGVASLACWLPSRNAARIQPMEALRV